MCGDGSWKLSTKEPKDSTQRTTGQLFSGIHRKKIMTTFQKLLLRSFIMCFSSNSWSFKNLVVHFMCMCMMYMDFCINRDF